MKSEVMPGVWHTVPIKRVALVRYGLGQPPALSDDGVAIIRATNIERGAINAHGLIYASIEDLPLDRAPLLTEGEILVVRSGAYTGDSALVTREWAGSAPGYDLRITPISIDSRYLAYAFLGKAVGDQVDIAKDRAAQPHLNAEEIRDIGVSFPSANRQKAVADFLDAETVRIDSLIAKKRRMIELAQSRMNNSMSSAMSRLGFEFPSSLTADCSQIARPKHWAVIRLSQALIQLTNGYVGPTRDILKESGVRYIQSLHIKDGRIDFVRRPFFVASDWHSMRPRIHLKQGDVLIVQTGDIGQVAVVPEGFGPASCHALQIARVRRDLLSGDYLAEYLRTRFGYQSLLSRATGALHPHLEGGIRDIPIVVPPIAVQQDLLNEVARERGRYGNLCGLLTRQIELLGEHRQALITAAVTGELEVSGRSSVDA